MPICNDTSEMLGVRVKNLNSTQNLGLHVQKLCFPIFSKMIPISESVSHNKKESERLFFSFAFDIQHSDCVIALFTSWLTPFSSLFKQSFTSSRQIER